MRLRCIQTRSCFAIDSSWTKIWKETRKERDRADREVFIIWPWTLHVLQRPWQSDTCAWLPWRSSADEPPDLPQMPFPSSKSHTSPINTLRLHQILDSSLYLSISATRETWDQIRRVTSSQNSTHRNLRCVKSRNSEKGKEVSRCLEKASSCWNEGVWWS